MNIKELNTGDKIILKAVLKDAYKTEDDYYQNVMLKNNSYTEIEKNRQITYIQGIKDVLEKISKK